MIQVHAFDCVPTALAVLAGVDRRKVPNKATPCDIGWTQADLMYVAKDLGLWLTPFPDVPQYAWSFGTIMLKNEGILLGVNRSSGRGHAMVSGPGYKLLDPADGLWTHDRDTYMYKTGFLTQRVFFAK